MLLQVDSDATLLLLAVGTTRYQHERDLEEVPDELRRVSNVFTALGYAVSKTSPTPEEMEDHTSAALKKTLGNFRRECGDDDLAVAYFTGHGAQKGRFYLLTHDSDPSNLSESAVSTEDLAWSLLEDSKAAQVLIILDVCYAGVGAADVIKIAERVTNACESFGPVPFVIAAAGPREEADQGALSRALHAVLRVPDESLGGRLQPYLNFGAVMGDVKTYLEKHYPAQKSAWSTIAAVGDCRLLPNPRYRADARVGHNLDTQQVWVEHCSSTAHRVGFVLGGLYFTGRALVLREIVRWLCGPSAGCNACVVTGGPGSGKSAVLSRITMLSDPNNRRLLLEGRDLDPEVVPPECSIDVAIDARHKLLSDVSREIAKSLKLEDALPDQIIRALAECDKSYLVVLDALDEADDREQILYELLIPLVRLPNVRLLVGTRPDGPEYKSVGRRFSGFPNSAIEIDLDEARWTGSDDVLLYVESRLLATEEPTTYTPYRDHEKVAKEVARAIAARANNNFLVAHTATLELLQSSFLPNTSIDNWTERLPTGLDEAFERFLMGLNERAGAPSSEVARAVLSTLALAEGEGLPWSNLWPNIASAVSGRQITNNDILCVCKHVGAFIVEALEAGDSVYRLYHELLAEHLLDSADDERYVQSRTVEALIDSVPRVLRQTKPDWSRAHVYVLRYLATHALKANRLHELLEDGSFAASADPLRLLSAMSESHDPFVRRVRQCYRLAFHSLENLTSEGRLSQLELAARKLGWNDLADTWVQANSHRRWSIPWVNWSPIATHRSIETFDRVNAMALGDIDGKCVAITGGYSGTIELIDVSSGRHINEYSFNNFGRIHSCAFGIINDWPFFVCGYRDGKVRVMHHRTSEPVLELTHGKSARVYSVAVGNLEGMNDPIIVSAGSDGRVLVWLLGQNTPHREIMHSHGKSVNCLALSDIGVIAGRSVIVSGGEDGKVRTWDIASGELLYDPLEVRFGEVKATTITTINNLPVIVAAYGPPDLDIWLWDLRTGCRLEGSLAQPKQSHRDVRAIAAGYIDGVSVVCTTGIGGKIDVWSLERRNLIAGPLIGHEDWGTSIALKQIDGEHQIVTGSRDKTVRVWDVEKIASSPMEISCHEGAVKRVMIRSRSSGPVAVSLGKEGSLLVHDTDSGAPIFDAPLDTGLVIREIGKHANESSQCIVLSEMGFAYVLDIESGERLDEPVKSPNRSINMTIVMCTVDGQEVVVEGDGEGYLWIWHLKDGLLLHKSPIRAHENWVESVEILHYHDRAAVLSCAWNSPARIWDIVSGEMLSELSLEESSSALTIGDTDGRNTIVFGCADGVVRIADAASSSRFRELDEWHEADVTAVTMGLLCGREVIVSADSKGYILIQSARDKQGDSSADVLEIGVGSSVTGLGFGGNTLIVASQGGLIGLRPHG